MANAMVSFRMDAELKKKMEDVCKALGLPISVAFTMFAAKVVQDRAIPFDLALPPLEEEN